MRIRPWETNVMRAGLTRGIWMDAPADRSREHRESLREADAGTKVSELCRRRGRCFIEQLVALIRGVVGRVGFEPTTY